MDYTIYEIEDFLTDDSFLNYCSGHNKQDVRFWEAWLVANPHKKETFNKAVVLYTSLNGGWEKSFLEKDFGVFKQKLDHYIAQHTDDDFVVNVQTRPTVKMWRTISGLVAAVVLIISGIYYFNQNVPQNKPSIQSGYLNDVGPGTSKATLTLSDGSQINLTSTMPSAITNKAGIAVAESKEGAVFCASGAQSENGKLMYNTIQTPRGGQYTVHLPDGTKVILNAASSLKFPTHFSATERQVELFGEGYFEVSKDKRRPFVVVANNQKIEVLGTHFNVNSYTEEKSIKTTLLEGSVKILVGNNAPVLLSPGQQSTVVQDDVSVKEVDVDKVTAWKNGYFVFRNDAIENVMQQVERWYDVNIIFKGEKPDIKFTGVISRTKNISAILNAIQETGNVQFKIDQKNITVFKKTN